MKTLAVILIFVLLSGAAFAQGTYTTPFPATENPISEGNRWINGGVTGGSTLWGNVRTTTGQAYGVSEPTTYGDPTAVLTGTWGATQTAEAVVKVSSTPTGCCHELELRLRSTISTNSNNGYEINCSVVPGNDYMQIVRWDGPNGSYHYLGTRSDHCINGDVIKAKISGTGAGTTIINVWKNGTLLSFDSGSGTNTPDPGTWGTPFTNGSPGIGFYNNDTDTGAWSDFGFSSFTASDGAATGVRKRVVVTR